jgi:hypothetical protein
MALRRLTALATLTAAVIIALNAKLRWMRVPSVATLNAATLTAVIARLDIRPGEMGNTVRRHG